MSKARYFTVIDLTSGYYQVPLVPDSRKYTGFICYRGLFEYLVLPMGLTNACETFQEMMNKVLDGLLTVICDVYLDDIIIYSNDLEEHVKHVQLVIDRLIQYNLKVKLEKSKICQDKIEYLSHTISHGQIQPSPAKVKDLYKYDAPLNVRQIHSFIGLGSYYKRFIKNFAAIISALLRAVQAEPFEWTRECQDAFDEIRNKLTSEPILVLPEFGKPFRLETDACNYGVGGVLTQEHDDYWKPIAYFSKHLNKIERKYSTTEKELYSIVLSAEHFRQFLYGIHLDVVTDHQPLKYLLKLQEPNSKLLRWLVRFLNVFNYTILYRKGSVHGNADALSRLTTHPDEDEDKDYDEPIIINYLMINNNNNNDEQLIDTNLKWLFDLKLKAIDENKHQIIVKNFDNEEQKSYYAQWSRIKLINNKLYREWTRNSPNENTIVLQYILPQHLRQKVLELAHDSVTSGHLGIEKTCKRIEDRYFWPKWKKQVIDYVLSCATCQQVKHLTQNKEGQLQAITPNQPFELLTADILGPLPKSNMQNSYALVVCDHFTKWVQVYPLRDITASSVAKRLVKFISIFGIPNQILTDQGSNFQSDMLEQLYELLDIHKMRTTPYHPQCDGLS